MKVPHLFSCLLLVLCQLFGPWAAAARALTPPAAVKAWPLAEHSRRYPLSVRFQRPGDRPRAREVLGFLEHAWQVEVEQLGFPPPFAYDPFAGPGPGRLNAYLQRGADTAVEGQAPLQQPGVWWDAYTTWISIDAWGKYAGPILASTTAHEFNHALQAADDWWESPGFFEASATYMQEKVTPDDNDYLQQIAEFQQHPDWPVHYDDAYRTWFMYGASLYLFFLEQRYFAGRPRFLAEIWAGSRNRPRPMRTDGTPAPASNEPDWVDALENLLPRGVSYAETLIAFARWRWYTGRHSDGRHFHEAALLGPAGEVKSGRYTGATAYVSPGPLLGGSAYLRLQRPADGRPLRFRFTGQAGIRWHLQVVPGLQADSDGEDLRLEQGQTSVAFGSLPERTLILTALPLDGVLDPDLQPRQRLAWRLSPVAFTPF